jgi:hypothetical protein
MRLILAMQRIFRTSSAFSTLCHAPGGIVPFGSWAKPTEKKKG